MARAGGSRHPPAAGRDRPAARAHGVPRRLPHLVAACAAPARRRPFDCPPCRGDAGARRRLPAIRPIAFGRSASMARARPAASRSGDAATRCRKSAAQLRERGEDRMRLPRRAPHKRRYRSVIQSSRPTACRILAPNRPTVGRPPGSRRERPATVPRSSWCRHCVETDRARCRYRRRRPRRSAAALNRPGRALPARCRAGEARQEQIAERGLLEWPVVQDQPRSRHGVQDARPGRDDVVVEPLGPAEMAEGDETVGQMPAAVRPEACPRVARRPAECAAAGRGVR